MDIHRTAQDFAEFVAHAKYIPAHYGVRLELGEEINVGIVSDRFPQRAGHLGEPPDLLALAELGDFVLGQRNVDVIGSVVQYARLPGP